MYVQQVVMFAKREKPPIDVIEPRLISLPPIFLRPGRLTLTPPYFNPSEDIIYALYAILFV